MALKVLEENILFKISGDRFEKYLKKNNRIALLALEKN